MIVGSGNISNHPTIKEMRETLSKWFPTEKERIEAWDYRTLREVYSTERYKKQQELLEERQTT